MHFAAALLALLPLVAAQDYGYGSPASSTSATASASSAAATVGATDTLVVTVGKGGELAFSPSVVSAAVGAKLEFHFYPKNHSVAQSSFTSPCEPLSGGVFAGFMPVSSSSGGSTTFTMTVNSTSPIWLYCPQTGHCQAGMAMVVNQPTDPTKSLTVYQTNAKGTSSSGEQPQVEGGVTASASAAASTASSTSSSPASTSSSAAMVGSVVDWSLIGLGLGALLFV